MKTTWSTAQIPSQAGKRAIVTGGNSGIGWFTSLELARAGADVTIAGRDDGRVEVAVSKVRAAVPSADVRGARLDLADFASIRAFAEADHARARPLDLLVHNAGVMALPRRAVSADGHELQFATNVLGPYLLTGLLLPRLLEASRPRIVTVSSNSHKMGGPVPLTDLDSTNDYRPIHVYCKTKLANLLFTKELQRRAGERLLCVSAHPGAAKTNLAADASLLMKLSALAIYPLIQEAEMGAAPTLMAATLENATPGGYYGPTRVFELRGPPAAAKPATIAEDEEAGRALFAALEQVTGLRYQLETGSPS